MRALDPLSQCLSFSVRRKGVYFTDLVMLLLMLSRFLKLVSDFDGFSIETTEFVGFRVRGMKKNSKIVFCTVS